MAGLSTSPSSSCKSSGHRTCPEVTSSFSHPLISWGFTKVVGRAPQVHEPQSLYDNHQTLAAWVLTCCLPALCREALRGQSEEVRLRVAMIFSERSAQRKVPCGHMGHVPVKHFKTRQDGPCLVPVNLLPFTNVAAHGVDWQITGQWIS